MLTTRRWLALGGLAVLAVAIAGFAMRGWTPRSAAAVPQPTAASWTQELESAKCEAALLGVDLLIVLREQAGIGLSSRDAAEELEDEVFSDDRVRQFLQQEFRIVELEYASSAPPTDIPHDLAGLGVVGHGDGTRDTIFPTIVLADVEGRPYAVPRAYVAGEGGDYAIELVELGAVRERRDEAFAAARRASGMERAKALAAGLAELDPGLVVVAYLDEVEEIIDLDRNGDAGLREQYERIARLAEVMPAVREVDDVALAAGRGVSLRRLKDLLVGVELAHADLPEVQQAARVWVAAAAARLALDASDCEAITRELEAAKALAPESCIVSRLDEALQMVAELRAALRK